MAWHGTARLFPLFLQHAYDDNPTAIIYIRSRRMKHVRGERESGVIPMRRRSN